MFVERSAARIRLVRTLFVAVCLLPTLGLAAWAVYRHGPAYVEPLLTAWSRSVGLTVSVGKVEHLRPSVVRLHDVALADARQRPIADVPLAELEERAEETLLIVPQLSLDGPAVASLADVAGRWLMEPIRFPRGGAVRVGELTWTAAGGGRPLGGFQIELVIVDGARAIRIRREPADGDELRLRAIASPGGPQLEAELICARGLPTELVAAACGWLPRFGPDAMIRGQLRGLASGSSPSGAPLRWSGSGQAVVTGVDLAGLAEVAGQAARGEAVLRIESLTLESGRITAADFQLSAEDGAIGRGLLERMVTVLGCRLGPAGAEIAAESDWLTGPAVPFDEAALAVGLTREGVSIESIRAGAMLVTWGGRTVLAAASERIPYERLAWLFAPTASGLLPATIPASPRALEVLSRLPIGSESPQGRF